MASLPPLRYRHSTTRVRRDVLTALRARNPTPNYKPWALLALLAAAYALSLADLRGGWLLAAIAFVQPVYLITALGIAHDASHGALAKRRWINRAGTLVFDLLGVNGYVWHFDHVVSHHAAPNVPRYDANLYVWGPLRLDPHAPLRRYHRFQHLYAPLLYALASLFKIYVEDFAVFARQRSDAFLPRRHSPLQYVRLIVLKSSAIAVTLIVPLLVHRETGFVLGGYLLGHVVSGLLMGAIFQPTHTNELVTHPRADRSGEVPTSFEEHVLATAADFAIESAWVTWIAGGLNIHAVHHLLPHVPQRDLRAAAAILCAVAPRHRLRYAVFPTWSAAIASHFRALKRLGERRSVEASARLEAA